MIISGLPFVAQGGWKETEAGMPSKKKTRRKKRDFNVMAPVKIVGGVAGGALAGVAGGAAY